MSSSEDSEDEQTTRNTVQSSDDDSASDSEPEKNSQPQDSASRLVRSSESQSVNIGYVYFIHFAKTTVL